MFASTKSVFGASVSVGKTSITGSDIVQSGKNVHIWGPIELGTFVICKAKAISLSSEYGIKIEGMVSLANDTFSVNIFENMKGGVIFRNGLQENIDKHLFSIVTESRSIEYRISPDVKSLSLRFTIFPITMAYDLFTFSEIPTNLTKNYFS